MKGAIGLFVAGVLAVSPAHADDRNISKLEAKVVPTGLLKAYKGPDGLLVAMVEINRGKEMLVHFRNDGGDLEGKTLRYLYEDLGQGNKTVYLDWQRGSKPYRRVLLSSRDHRWELFHPNKPNTHFELRYSEEASEKFKIDDIIKAMKKE
jgi:hypothetical protein